MDITIGEAPTKETEGLSNSLETESFRASHRAAAGWEGLPSSLSSSSVWTPSSPKE